MNSLLEQELPGNTDLRDQLLDMISDQDLTCKLPGHNPTLGELCVEMGHIQQAYIHSFRTFKHDWSYRDSEPEAAHSVASLKAWFQKLDAELLEVLGAFSEDDIHTQQIDRGGDDIVTIYVQVQIYREAILIFYAKASVYLKAMERPLNDQWKAWVG
jgi:hypothetical protein